MPAQLIPHLQGTGIIGDYKILKGNFPGISPPDFLAAAPYLVKDLPDISEVHLDAGSTVNVESIRLRVTYRGHDGRPGPPPHTDIDFDKTWMRDEFAAICLNGDYKNPTGIQEAHSDPVAGIRTVASDEERAALTPLFLDEIISQNGVPYLGIRLIAGAWRRTRFPIQISARKRSHALNALGSEFRRSRGSDHLDSSRDAESDRCELVFFDPDGFYTDGSIIIGANGPGDMSLFSASAPPHPPNPSAPGFNDQNYWQLGRFRNFLSTRAWIFDPNAGWGSGAASGVGGYFKIPINFGISEGIFNDDDGARINTFEISSTALWPAGTPFTGTFLDGPFSAANITCTWTVTRTSDP